MKFKWLFFFVIAIVAVAVVVLVFAPAQWMSALVKRASHDRVELAEASGTFWSGQAVLVVGGERHGAGVGISLPQPLSWRLSPTALATGRIDLSLTHPSALAQPLRLQADSSRRVEVGPATLRLPASLLTGLGAPWNTLKFGGTLVLNWDHLSIDGAARRVAGNLSGEWQQATSSLTPVAPFGHYRLTTNGVYPGTQLKLLTIAGPLEMVGDGTIDANGKLRFDGTVQAMVEVDPTVKAQLAGLVSLLGRRAGDSATLKIGN